MTDPSLEEKIRQALKSATMKYPPDECVSCFNVDTAVRAVMDVIEPPKSTCECTRNGRECDGSCQEAEDAMFERIYGGEE